MVLERTKPFRLVERGGPGPSCDADGVSLGVVALVSLDSEPSDGARYVVRTINDVGDILGAAYGSQHEHVVQRIHRGLLRVASALRAEDLALAGIETVMLAMPELDAEAIAKLARFADFEKGGDSLRDEPRVPAGQPEGGQWTSGGAGASGLRTMPKPSQQRPRHGRAGQAVTSPNAPQARRPNASPRPPSATVPRTPHEPLRSNDPVSSSVDFSNAVAGALVGSAHWLQQPAVDVPVAPEIAAGEPGFPMGAAVEETSDPKAFRDWRPVSHLEAGLDALGVVGAIAPGIRAAAEGSEAAVEVKRFGSLFALRQYLGPAGEGNQWHHIVEQTPANLKRFGAEAIHSTDNVVRVPTPIHVGKNSISAYYSRNQWFFGRSNHPEVVVDPNFRSAARIRSLDPQEIHGMEVTDPERHFAESARLHGLYTNEGDARATNAAYDETVAALRALRTRPDRGQRFLLRCLANSDPSVVTAAALYLLPDREAEAVEALKRVAHGKDLIAFGAEMVLKEWRAGRLKVE